MSSTIPPDVVEIKKDGYRKGTGYVYLGENRLVVHWLSEWYRVLQRAEEGRVAPIMPYTEFVRTTYAENPEAVSRILSVAKEEPLRELEQLRIEFNSLLFRDPLTDEVINLYIAKVDTILRK